MYPSILFEDEYIAVIEKGPDMVVNRAGSVSRTTLQDWVEENIKFQTSEIKNKPENEFVMRSGIVHRLDRETSGIILVGKREDAFSYLQSQFKDRTVKKEYTLLVHGHFKSDTGVIDVPLGRLPWNRMRFGVIADGRPAQTEYRVVQEKYIVMTDNEKVPVSMVTAFPKTGRTHQLRVHFQHIHHPVFADALYGGRKKSKKDRVLLSRQFLHASAIEFSHPKTGAQMRFESALPPDLVAMTLRFA